MRILLVLFVLLTITSCKSKPSVNIDGLKKVEVSSNALLENINEDELCDSIWKVQLETNKNCLIAYCDRLLIKNRRIIVFDRSQSSVFIFNAEGKYLSKIHSIGKGPGEYLSIEEVYINSKEELVLIDPSISKRFVYSLEGEFLSEEKIGRNAFYSMYELKDGGSVTVKGKKWGEDSNTMNNSLICTTPSMDKLYFLPNEGELKIKVIAPDSYIMDTGDEILIHLPFSNKIYELKDYELYERYEFDFLGKSLPDKAFFSINNDYFMRKYYDNNYYNLIIGSIFASENYIIIPVVNNKVLLGSIWYSRNTDELKFFKKMIGTDNSETKLFVRNINRNTIACINDSYNNYMTNKKTFTELDMMNLTVTFVKIKEF